MSGADDSLLCIGDPGNKLLLMQAALESTSTAWHSLPQGWSCLTERHCTCLASRESKHCHKQHSEACQAGPHSSRHGIGNSSGLNAALVMKKK